jgi:hypothetical protein
MPLLNGLALALGSGPTKRRKPESPAASGSPMESSRFSIQLGQVPEPDLATDNIPHGGDVINTEETKKSANESKRMSSSTRGAEAMEAEFRTIGPQ